MLVYGYVYGIKNEDTNKMYIGSSLSVSNRLETHFTNLNKGVHICKAMQADHRKDTKYTVYILSIVLDKDMLTKEEARQIEIYRTTNPKYGYNTHGSYRNINNVKGEIIYQGEARSYRGRLNKVYGLGWLSKEELTKEQ